ncbi:hypothetical protein KUTeg_013478 [Tegillarca granosa]|uniref:Uncharacterized protein n=1 Tax=Tegillarca granosa TaxID=220873 RepID=A0ABQ9ETT4_TEGGR|nr:hypothetical protein KUTeg_013478 [Tegillarca granosa]
MDKTVLLGQLIVYSVTGRNGPNVPIHVVTLGFENVKETYCFQRHVEGLVQVIKMNLRHVIGIVVVTIHLGVNGIAKGSVQTVLNFVISPGLDLCVIDLVTEYQRWNVKGCVKQKRLINGAQYSAVTPLVWSRNGPSGGVVKVSVNRMESSIEHERLNGSQNVGLTLAPSLLTILDAGDVAVQWIVYWAIGVFGLSVTLHVESGIKLE